MSLIAMTGFDHDVYGQRFGIAGTIASPGRFGRGRYARFSNGNHYASLALDPSEYHNAYVIGFACRESVSPYVDLAYSSGFIHLNGDSGAQMQIYWTNVAAGQYAIRVRRGNGTILHTSPPISIVHGVWRYYEFKVTIDDTVGAVEVRRDGLTVINISGIDTRNGGTTANIHSITFGQNAENGVGSLDDVYVIKNDGTGQTDFLGEIEVEALTPNGNGNSSQLVGSDGNSVDNYLLVDDSPGINDADYVSSAIDGEIDTYTMSNLIRPATVIKGVQVSFRARKSDTANKSMRRIVRTNGVDYSGPDTPLPSTFMWTHEVIEQNPNTGADWTQGDIDSLETGVEVRP